MSAIIDNGARERQDESGLPRAAERRAPLHREHPPIDAGRRRFLVTSAGAAAGLVIGFYLPAAAGRFALSASAQEPQPAAKLPAPNAFLRIGADDSVTVLLAHSEMGQGIWTTLAMMVAEELECDWAKVRVEHAPAAPAYAHAAFGIQMTGGSTTTWSEFDRYRQVGAMARDMLVRAAAAEWNVPPADCRVANGIVSHGDRRLSFGALASKAEQLAPPASVTLKPASAWTRIGKPTKRLDSREKVTGKAQFGLDVQFPGLMTALVLRAPVFGGTVKRFNGDKAKAVPGVKTVVQVPSGVAVVAEHFWAAKLGRDALEVEWDGGDGANVDTDALRAEYRKLAATPGARAAGKGTIAAAAPAGGAARTLEAEYTVPFLAHATMEPLNCTVRIASDGCEIWTGTQFQTLDQAAAAKITGLKPEQVQIHTTFLGGGFGRRATPSSDFVVEAVHVAKAAGLPVKTVWTREDDIRGGYYRPLWLDRIRVSLGADGLPESWDQTIVGQSFLAGSPFAAMIKDGVDGTSVEGAADSPYVTGTPNHQVQLHLPTSPVPTLWWRSVGHSHNGFVMESVVDELAAMAKQDPLAYRRKLLKDHPRHLGVLNLAAEQAGWGKKLPAGHAFGLAVHESFGSWVAHVAEVSIESGGRIRVHRVVAAIDCGVCINPEGVRAQLESGAVFGLSAALYGELTIKEGRVQQSNFHDYQVLRLHEMPKVEVHIVPSTEKSGGVGEPGTPPIAPAVANAVFALTGQRLRSLPLRLPADAKTSPSA
jgi:isoquinoline 1-oxidoreductase beta subunit